MDREFQQLMLDNVSLGRWEDEEGNPNCNVCNCPLVMHMFALGCGARNHGCRNPNCVKKDGS